ncbi:unnamed protein product [Schistocephalus solidus]|uniref:6-phosphogluconolactonase n=1 Tax=Schistocephalus solidus TaxID=70667 RepID=A0A183T1U5_SCHSO|nr:unnamed protein product [Schistocephalus solidus]
MPKYIGRNNCKNTKLLAYTAHKSDAFCLATADGTANAILTSDDAQLWVTLQAVDPVFSDI